MSDFYLGQIVLTAFERQMSGWRVCDGSLLRIDDSPELFDLIGTIYGGDGTHYFALPDLRGRLPIGCGKGTYPTASYYEIGATIGVEELALGVSQIPAHRHPINTSAADADTTLLTSTSVFGACVSAESKHYVSNPQASTIMRSFSSNTIQSVGANAPHNNLMPSIALCYQICISGMYTSQAEENHD